MKNGFRHVPVVCVLAILAIGMGFLSRTERRQGAVLAGLQKEKTDLEALRAENEKWKALRVDAAELTRLREETADLPKLRNQVRQLRDAMTSQDAREPELMRQLLSENEQLQQQKRELQELPNRAACIRNLELIDAAKRQWAEQHGAEKGERVTTDVLAAFFPNGFPNCPDGGHYSVNRIGAPPGCSISGHAVP
ncbi:MAG: hypothetical protein QOJ40_812 [Verrucomicrobiota bacterium]